MWKIIQDTTPIKFEYVGNLSFTAIIEQVGNDWQLLINHKPAGKFPQFQDAKNAFDSFNPTPKVSTQKIGGCRSCGG